MSEVDVVIGDRTLAPGKPIYVIAEIGSNHNQDKARALDMIAQSAECGADAVKFQSLRFDRMYLPENESEDFRKWYQAIELDESWYHDLAKAAADAGVDFLSAPCYPQSVPLLEAVGVPAYKLGSSQVQGDPRTIRAVAQTGKPIIMSAGYCEKTDLERALALCAEEGNRQIVILHCVSKYPAEFSDCNLHFMTTLSETFGLPVGLSDHTPGGHLAVTSVALNCCVIEKHVTDDKSLDGPDHHFALNFEEFARMTGDIRDIESAMGSSAWPTLPPEVQNLRRRYRYKAFAAEDVKAGELIPFAAYRSENYDDAFSADAPHLATARASKDIAKGQPILADCIDDD